MLFWRKSRVFQFVYITKDYPPLANLDEATLMPYYNPAQILPPIESLHRSQYSLLFPQQAFC